MTSPAEPGTPLRSASPRERPSLVTGADGRQRCAWVGADRVYEQYHDNEWGRPVRGEHALFERVALEGFQSGLSWLTILKRREGFRAAFARFDPAAVAAFTDDDVDDLMQNSAIIRNRRKIEATIENARALTAWHDDEPEALSTLVWSFAPTTTAVRPQSLAEVPASSEASRELARRLKARGLRFVGPTTMYALLQAVGVIDDHVAGCWRAS